MPPFKYAIHFTHLLIFAVFHVASINQSVQFSAAVTSVHLTSLQFALSLSILKENVFKTNSI